MSDIEAGYRIAPLLNTATNRRVANISVTTTSARHDLTLRLSKCTEGHYYTFKAIGGTVYLAFNNADAGTVDETAAVAGVTECFALTDGESTDWEFVENYTWLVVKGSVACSLRIALSSKNPNQTTVKGEL